MWKCGSAEHFLNWVAENLLWAWRRLFSFQGVLNHIKILDRLQTCKNLCRP